MPFGYYTPSKTSKNKKNLASSHKPSPTSIANPQFSPQGESPKRKKSSSSRRKEETQHLTTAVSQPIPIPFPGHFRNQQMEDMRFEIRLIPPPLTSVLPDENSSIPSHFKTHGIYSTKFPTQEQADDSCLYVRQNFSALTEQLKTHEAPKISSSISRRDSDIIAAEVNALSDKLIYNSDDEYYNGDGEDSDNETASTSSNTNAFVDNKSSDNNVKTSLPVNPIMASLILAVNAEISRLNDIEKENQAAKASSWWGTLCYYCCWNTAKAKKEAISDSLKNYQNNINDKKNLGNLIDNLGKKRGLFSFFVTPKSYNVINDFKAKLGNALTT